MGILINSYLPFGSSFDKSGIKAYYHLDESSGTVVNAATTSAGFSDGLGTAANSSSTDGTPLQNQTGFFDKCVKATGAQATDFFVMGTSKAQWKFLHSQDFTIAFWFKATDLTLTNVFGMFGTPIGGTNIGTVLGGRDGSGSNSNTLRCRMENGTGNASQIQSSADYFLIDTTNWYHFIITFKASDQSWNIYRDNANNESTTSSLTLSTSNPTEECEFCGTSGGGYYNIAGFIDEFVVFNRIITADERAYLYNSGNGQLIA